MGRGSGTAQGRRINLNSLDIAQVIQKSNASAHGIRQTRCFGARADRGAIQSDAEKQTVEGSNPMQSWKKREWSSVPHNKCVTPRSCDRKLAVWKSGDVPGRHTHCRTQPFVSKTLPMHTTSVAQQTSSRLSSWALGARYFGLPRTIKWDTIPPMGRIQAAKTYLAP